MIRRLGPLLACAALAGCSLEPAYIRPAGAVTPSWPVGDAYLRQSEAGLPALSYRDVFQDPKLQAIIAQALANNQNIRLALANARAARADYRIARANIFPQVDASGRVVISDSGNGGSTTATGTGTGVGTGTGGTGTGGTGTGTGGTGTGGTGGTGTGGNGTGGIGSGTGTGNGGTGTTITTSGAGTTTVYSLEAGVSSFELDLFGRLRSLSNAAFDEYLGQEAAVRAGRLTIVAEIASAYYALATDRTLLRIALDTQKSAGESVRLTNARLQGGISPRTELRQAETVLATARADYEAQTTLVAQDRNALELLVGARVADANLPSGIAEVDAMVGELPAGLGSEILLRRPDVVQAEYQLRAANARIGAARAAFFPRIGLTAVAGLASTALSSLFTGGAFNWTVQPSASLPIFDGGANRGNLDYARATRDYAVANYQLTIQTAFREVSDALARRGTVEREVAATRELTLAAQDTLNLATAAYRGGITTFLETLDAQRTYYSAQRSLATVRFTRAYNLVTLYRVLGGDELIAAMPAPTGNRATRDEERAVIGSGPARR